MASRRLTDKITETETGNCAAAQELSQTDPTNFPSQGTERKKNVMELVCKNSGIPKKSRTPKSKVKRVRYILPKVKQVCTDYSKAVSVCKKKNSRKRTRIGDLFDDVEAEFSVKERALRALDCLGYDLPHFIKCMLPSNVAHGFWLHLPRKFCNAHLPHRDTSITLVDEWDNEYETTFLLDKYGLSAGWRGFSMAHRLLKGDILIFHLIAPCKLKINIVRVNGPNVVGAALALLKMSTCGAGADAEGTRSKKQHRGKKTKFVEPYLLDCPAPLPNNEQKNVPSSNTGPAAAHQSGNENDNFDSKVAEGEVRNPSKPGNKQCHPETSFLQGHSHEGVTCM